MRGQAEPGQLDLGDGEEAGHEVLVAELHLEDVHVERRLAAPPEADLTHRGLPPGQLLEARAHRPPGRQASQGASTRSVSQSVPCSRAPVRSAPMPAATTKPTPSTGQRPGTWCSSTRPITRAIAGSRLIRVPKAEVVSRRSASISRLNGTTGSRIARPKPTAASCQVIEGNA